MSNYIAFTIGPIYETMKYCQKTRELWVGSYFFSYFMKTLIKELLKEENKIKLLIPYVDDKLEILDMHYEEGVFHDRFIAKTDKEKVTIPDILEDSIDCALEVVMVNLNIEDQYYAALKNYLQYTFIVANEEELLKETGKENIVFAIDAILDTMELQNNFDFENSTKVCTIDQNDLKHKKEGYVNPLAKLQYEATSMKEIPQAIKQTNIVFKSIPKIAIANIWKEIESDEKNSKVLKDLLRKIEKDVYIEKNTERDMYELFYETLAIDKKDLLKPHHKYYAVIYADGDKMGSTIRNIYNEENKDKKIKAFSENIYKYIREGDSLSKIFDDFGGMVIYAGGDDLLAFSPIFGKDGTSIFDLLEKLSSKFTSEIGSDVTLSFGVSICYYKSPMIESINKAGNLLFETAKAHNTKEKSGSIALSLTKQSGQTFDSVFFLDIQDNSDYTLYKNLLNDELKEESDMNLPHNIQYKLKNAEYLICDIYKNNQEDSNRRISALFENSFKDGTHTEKIKSGLDRLKTYIQLVQPADNDMFDKLISQLAIIKFLRGDQ